MLSVLLRSEHQGERGGSREERNRRSRGAGCMSGEQRGIEGGVVVEKMRGKRAETVVVGEGAGGFIAI